MRTPDPWDPACPSREIIAAIGDKWTLLLLPILAEGPKRNGELMRRVGGISQKMLTQTLKELERNGLVERRDHHEVPPRVDYSLTPLGRSLGEAIAAVDRWVVDNYAGVMAARRASEGTTGTGAPD